MAKRERWRESAAREAPTHQRVRKHSIKGPYIPPSVPWSKLDPPQDHTCRWPMWDNTGRIPRPAPFCPAERMPGKSYCYIHWRVAGIHRPPGNNGREFIPGLFRG